MNIRTTQNMSADIRDESGMQKVMLHAGYGARSLNLTVEVLDPAYVKANAASAEEDVAQFVAAACAEAAKAGLPTSRITEG